VAGLLGAPLPYLDRMNVTSGLTYEKDGAYRKHSVNLGFGDLVRLVDEKKVKGYHLAEEETGVRIVDDAGERMPLVVAYRVLQAQADILVWFQTAAEGGAAFEFAEKKINECLNRARILLR
jgi:hypothetical protein